MFISKHHYALALSRMGNDVYYINGPNRTEEYKSGEVRIAETNFPNLYSVTHKLYYPLIIKHKAEWLHKMLLKKHISNILNAIGKKVDLVWSFDISNTMALSAFPEDTLKIYMPVDNPTTKSGIKAADTADLILSVTNEILEQYSQYNTKRVFLNHGVLSDFISDDSVINESHNIKVGLSGNFLRKDIDWHTLTDIITSHKDIEFNFWGAIDARNANLADDFKPNPAIEKVMAMDNVVIHGAVDPFTLAHELKKMDMFLICYDINKDHSKGTNYHKVLEYLATGKVVVSNNITTYSELPGLVEMPVERNNTKLPELFSKVLSQLQAYNSNEKREYRIAYARSHTYQSNINKVAQLLTSAQAS